MWPSIMVFCDWAVQQRLAAAVRGRHRSYNVQFWTGFFKDALQQVSTASCNMAKEFLAMVWHIMHHQD